MKKDTKNIIDYIEKKNKDKNFFEFIKFFYNYVPEDYFNFFTEEELYFLSEKSFFNINNLDKKFKIDIEYILSPKKMLFINILSEKKSNLVDSIQNLLEDFNIKYEFFQYALLPISRNEDGNFLDFNNEKSKEISITITCFGEFDDNIINKFKDNLSNNLEKIYILSEILPEIYKTLNLTKENILRNTPKINDSDLYEVVDFVNWSMDDNFYFLGLIELDIKNKKLSSQLGNYYISDDELDIIWSNIENINYKKDINIAFGKINKISVVHKSNFIDFFVIKNYDDEQNFTKVYVYFGLYNPHITIQSVKEIPIIRQKIKYSLDSSKFVKGDYYYKKINLIFESLPTEALFHINSENLFDMCLKITSSMSMNSIKLFMPNDCSKNFEELIIFLPRNRLTPDVYKNIYNFISDRFNTKIVKDYINEINQNFVFVYFTFTTSLCIINKLEINLLEKEIENITSFWLDNLYKESINLYGEILGKKLFLEYAYDFKDNFKYFFSPNHSARYLEYIDLVNNKISIKFLFEEFADHLSVKIFSKDEKLELSTMMPQLESLGFYVLDQQTFIIGKIYFHKFLIKNFDISINFSELKEIIEDALTNIYLKNTSFDQLSSLISKAYLTWREVELVRALTSYIHQTKINYDLQYIKTVLIKHHYFTKNIINLFGYKFNHQLINLTKLNQLREELADYLNNVSVSSEDKVLSYFLLLLDNITRTNYFQKTNSENKSYISFKINSSKMNILPDPKPFAEIFVYGKDFFGIHLRGGKISRGGIRWSDRVEDLRTEILGLMKAQLTKNTIIVPEGAKGGFVVNIDSKVISHDFYMENVVKCYQNFLRGLLDITDNIIQGKIIFPKDTIIYDGDDPYLVVAADKGTASFSDFANEISEEYNFWLGDAFASGGSKGYDHKKMAITARGAWISGKLHFKNMGIDIENDVTTVVGIGDMSGDVFGNGMLLSKKIKLLAAFNHMHIFIDPNPDTELSYNERKRLFYMPRSKWTDYDSKIISEGGGVYSRNDKIINLSKKAMEMLELDENLINPDELIKAILKLKVDFMWNGGIGTYIKSSKENNSSIGDKLNDNVRINGNELNAKIVCEGGNLGFSQLGRIEYAKNGGRINTDFIDNSAGVDCSDHEVNIKILLKMVVDKQKITQKERDEILFHMTPEVADLSLKANSNQNYAISIMEYSESYTAEIFAKFFLFLEENKILNRNVEFLPSHDDLIKRSLKGESLTRPEIAILISYSKIYVYKDLLDSQILTENYFDNLLVKYFPKKIQNDFLDEVYKHPLKKEIILNEITNQMVNMVSGPIISQIQQETGAMICDIARGFYIVYEIFNLDEIWKTLNNIPVPISDEITKSIFYDYTKFIRRSIIWIVQNLPHPINIFPAINMYKDHINDIINNITDSLFGHIKDKYESKYSYYSNSGLSSEFCKKFSMLDLLISSFDICNIHLKTKADKLKITKIYFLVGNEYHLDVLRKSLDFTKNHTYWDRLALQSIKDDIYQLQREVVNIIIKDNKIDKFDEWKKDNEKYSKSFVTFIAILKKNVNLDINTAIIAKKKFEMFIRKL